MDRRSPVNGGSNGTLGPTCLSHYYPRIQVLRYWKVSCHPKSLGSVGYLYPNIHSPIVLGNAVWLNIVDVVVAASILPVLLCLVVYFLIALDLYSISVTTFCWRLNYEGCVPGTVPWFLLPCPELYPNVGNRSLEMSSNIQVWIYFLSVHDWCWGIREFYLYFLWLNPWVWIIIFIIIEGMSITLLVYCIHETLIYEVSDSYYVVGVSCKWGDSHTFNNDKKL